MRVFRNIFLFHPQSCRQGPGDRSKCICINVPVPMTNIPMHLSCACVCLCVWCVVWCVWCLVCVCMCVRACVWISIWKCHICICSSSLVTHLVAVKQCHHPHQFGLQCIPNTEQSIWALFCFGLGCAAVVFYQYPEGPLHCQCAITLLPQVRWRSHDNFSK